MRRARLLLAGIIVGTTLGIAAPSKAEECRPDDGRICCKTTADKINSVSRRLVGQDLVSCTQ